MEKLKSYLNLNTFFIFAFLIVGLLPTFGSIDKIGPQWLYLAIVNTLFYIFYDIPSLKNIITFLTHRLVLTFSIFLVLILFSFLFSNNQVESLIIFSRWFIIFLSFVSLIILFQKSHDFKLVVSFILTLVLLVELTAVFYSYFEILSLAKYNLSYSNFLIGVTGNKNVAASILAIKIPFVLYLFFNLRHKGFIFFIAFISFLSFYAIFILNSRTILLGLIVSIFCFLISGNSPKVSKKWLLIPLSALILFISLPFNDFSNKSFLSSRLSVTDNNSLARLDFYDTAFSHLISNPFVGVGIGNWKIESLKYSNHLMKDYTVAYHVHNDFLEIAVELGIFGFISYLFLFVFSFKFIIQNRASLFHVLLGCSLIIYFLDSMLNFPMSRVSNQILFVLLLASIVSLNKTQNESI